MQAYFDEAPGTSYEKLYNFTKFVPRATLTRFLARIEIFRKVLEVQGDIVECGVLFGGSLMTWAHASSIFEPLNSQRRI
ncbi:MAG: class I SAM-dependent methyltransferase, partial [Polyangiales bacterium]